MNNSVNSNIERVKLEIYQSEKSIDLVHYGKKLTSQKQQLTLLIKEIWNTVIYTVKYGREGRGKAEAETKNYFKERTIQVIKEMNTNVLININKIDRISEEEFAYLQSQLKPEEVLKPNSPAFREILDLHRFYEIKADVLNNPETHWLAPLSKDQLEEIDPAKNPNNKHKQIIRLREEWEAHLSPAFVPLLLFITHPIPLMDITDEHIQSLIQCLKIYQSFPSELEEKTRLEMTQKYFLILEGIAQNRDREKRNKFGEFFAQNKQIGFHLLKKVSLEDLNTSINQVIDQLLTLQSYFQSPAAMKFKDIAFCQTLEEMIEKQRNLNSESLEQYGKNFAENAKRFLSAGRKSQAINDFLFDVKSIQQSFELFDQGKIFKELLEACLPKKGLKDEIDIRDAHKRLKKASKQISHIARQITNQNYFASGANPDELMSLFNNLFASSLGVDRISYGVAGHKVKLKHVPSELEVAKRIEKFNEDQLKTAKDRWNILYGSKLAKQLESYLDSDVKNNKIYYRAKDLPPQLTQLHQYAEQFKAAHLSKEFVIFIETNFNEAVDLDSNLNQFLQGLLNIQPRCAELQRLQKRFKANYPQFYKKGLESVFNLTDTRSLEQRFIELETVYHYSQSLGKPYGHAFEEHLGIYLISPEGKTQLQQPHFIQKTLPAWLKQFDTLKTNFIEKQKLDPAEFNQLFKQALSEPSFILEPQSLERFRESVQRHLNEKKLEHLKEIHGQTFASYMRTYLEDYEKEVMIGKKDLGETVIYQSKLEDRLKLLLPTIHIKLSQTEAGPLLDLETIKNYLIPKQELLDPKQFDQQFQKLKALGSLRSKKETEQTLNIKKELIRFSPQLDLTVQGHTKTVKNNLQKLTDFCLTVDKHGIYPAPVLAKAVLTFAKNPSLTKELNLQILLNEKSDTIAACHKLCVDQFIDYTAEQFYANAKIEYDETAQNLMKSLSAHLENKQEGLLTPQACQYLTSVINLSLSLLVQSEGSVEYFSISRMVFVKEANQETIILDLDKLNAKNPPKILKEVQERLAFKINEKKGTALRMPVGQWIKNIRNNPFSVIEHFVPRFIVNLLPKDINIEEKQAKQEEIRQALLPLDALINQSNFVALIVEKLTTGLATLNIFERKITSKEGIIDFIREQVHDLLSLDLEKLKKVQSYDEGRQFIDATNSEHKVLVGTMTGILTEIILDAHVKIQKGDEKELKEDAIAQFLMTQLSDITNPKKSKAVNDKLDKWLDPITQIANQISENSFLTKVVTWVISKKYLKKLKLDPELQEMILKSLKPILKILSLALPELIKNHPIEGHLKFLRDLDQILKTKVSDDKKISESQADLNQIRLQLLANDVKFKKDIFVLVASWLQHIAKEFSEYGPDLLDALNYLETCLKQENTK